MNKNDAPDLIPIKPADCTCLYPEAIARNMCSHDETCPVYISWAAKVELERLANRVKVLEDAIRTHRSQLADDRCIEDDDQLYEALGDRVKCDRRVGSKEEMLRNCARFIENLCEEGHWSSYENLRCDLRDTVDRLEAISHGNFSTLVQNLREKHHLDDDGEENRCRG